MHRVFYYCYDRRSRIAVFVLILLILPMLTGCKKRQDILFDVEMESESSDNMNTPEISDNMEMPESTDNEQDSEEIPTFIYVHICGAVVNPGVYELPAGSRVFTGIEAAGGLLETAYGDYVNQAETLWDGQQLVIPTIEEIEAAKEDGTYEQLWANNAGNKTGTPAGNESAFSDAGTMGANHNGKININTATESQLLEITGIGATRAAAIVQYREEHGSFSSIEDIMQVSGIKEGTYEKIKDEITVD